jgi:eukaryotic-like serine/threonine-protein kinase
MPEDLNKNGSSFEHSETQVFLDLAMERGYATQAQTEEVLEIRKQLKTMGLEETVRALMIKKGFLSEAQANRIGKAVSGQRKIGNYQILARIGQGSMGSVFKARQISMDRNVAVKILPPKLAADKDYVRRFLHEARAVAKLNHENIVQGIDVGEEKGYFFFAMEYVEGVTVREALKNKGPYAEAEALNIALQMAKALEHASNAGLVHRDVKPDNIIVTPGGTAKLLDLGIAKTQGGAEEKGVRFGTPYYISPEQARGAAEVDTRSDIYSLGATLYHMVVGSPPFSGGSAAEVIQAHLTANVPDPREARPGLSNYIGRVITTMMAREPGDRYQDPQQLLSDLERLSRNLPPRLTAGDDSEATGSTRPARKVAKLLGVPLPALIVAGLALVGIVSVSIWLALRPPAKPIPEPDKPDHIVKPPDKPDKPIPTPVPDKTPEVSLLAVLRKNFRNTDKLEDLRYDVELLTQAISLAKLRKDRDEATTMRRKLQGKIDNIIGGDLNRVWLKAQAACRQNHFSQALQKMQDFPAAHREIARWKKAWTGKIADIKTQTREWKKLQESVVASHLTKGHFDKARKVIKAMAVAGPEVLGTFIADSLTRIDLAEKQHARQLLEDLVRRTAERQRQIQIQHATFLNQLYRQQAKSDFSKAESYCRQAGKDPKFALIKNLISDELDDLAAMQAASKEVGDLLGKITHSLTITHRGREYVGKLRKNDDKLFFVVRGGHVSFPLKLSEISTTELLQLTNYHRKAATPAACSLFLFWRGDFRAARQQLAGKKGPVVLRAIERLDKLQKGVTEIFAEDLLAKLQAAFKAKNYQAFKTLNAELRGKYSKTKAFLKAQPELTRMETQLAIANLDLATLTVGKTNAAADLLRFDYDFNFDSAQILDWKSLGDMWSWKTHLYQRQKIDTFLANNGTLIIRSRNRQLLQVPWAVPIVGLKSIEFEVVPLRGDMSLGFGLGHSKIYFRKGAKAQDLLRVWFPGNRPAYMLQGAKQRVTSSQPSSLRQNRTYKIKLQISGTEVKVFLNGRELLRDRLAFNVSAGCNLILGTWQSEAAFDNLKIICKPTSTWLQRRANQQAELTRAKLKPGLSVEYFNDKLFKARAARRIRQGTLHWWNQKPPAPGVKRDNFSVRFTGKFYVAKAGRYTIHQRADDNGRVLIDGREIIKGTFNRQAPLDLKTGWHDLIMEVSDEDVYAGMELSWEAPGIPRQPIPYELLGH